MRQLTTNDTTRLAMVGAGQQVKLVKIIAGHKLTHRLTDLGLTPGTELKIIQDQGGPLIIAVRGSRVVLGRGVAHKLLVQSLTANQPVNIPQPQFENLGSKATYC